MSGELLWAAYAPVGAKANDDDRQQRFFSLLEGTEIKKRQSALSHLNKAVWTAITRCP